MSIRSEKRVTEDGDATSVRPQRVLVTGATGFTGGHLARRLAELGYTVRALVRDVSKARHLVDAGIETVAGDLRDRESLQQATTGIDTVYHIGAAYRQESIGRQAFFDINTVGTENLLAAARSAGVRRYVHCSTVGVHGSIREVPANEDTPFAPADHYQESKLEGEKIARQYQNGGDMEVVIFRPGAIYGPGDLRFLKLFRAIKSRRFVMLGSGEVPYHLTFIDDLVDGIILCGTRDAAVGETFILAGPSYDSINDIVATIAGELNVPTPKWSLPIWPFYGAGFVCEHVCRPLRIEPPIFRRRLDFFIKPRAFDTSKAERTLGYRPKISLHEGIQRTISWYEQLGHL